MSSIEDREPLLQVRDLQTFFYTEDGVVKAVDGVSFDVHAGEVFSLVGESGCGKSVTSLSVMRLVGAPGRVVSGQILFEGKDLLTLSEEELTTLRGNRISMIFQQPQSSLDPVFTIGDQIAEVFRVHEGMDSREAWRRAVDLLELVGMPDAEKKAHAYPHEISGGQAQRVMIAMALALKPSLLIADEPTTALDVTIQAQILELILGLRREFGTAVILITHDLGVVAETADRVAVMYAGKIVEQADCATLFDHPRHPYTQGLLGSMPVLGQVADHLDAIPGVVPDLLNPPPGCRFAPRCRARVEHHLQICAQTEPELTEVDDQHWARCWLAQAVQSAASSPSGAGQH
jgi:oligopeptide/dipeptide ABC transporter ATP-binding protein